MLLVLAHVARTLLFSRIKNIRHFITKKSYKLLAKTVKKNPSKKNFSRKNFFISQNKKRKGLHIYNCILFEL